jgi:hypothetical protein
MGCKGPTTYNACSTVRWNEGHQLPDQGRPRLHRLQRRRLLGQGLVLRPPDRHHQFGVEANADRSAARPGVVGAAVAAHAAVSAIKRAAPEDSKTKKKTNTYGRLRNPRLQARQLRQAHRRRPGHAASRATCAVEVNLDSNNVIRNAVSTGTMWRGLEVILKGRDPRDAWAFTERICGVCTGTHALTSVRAVEDALGIKIPKTPTPSAT